MRKEIDHPSATESPLVFAIDTKPSPETLTSRGVMLLSEALDKLIPKKPEKICGKVWSILFALVLVVFAGPMYATGQTFDLECPQVRVEVILANGQLHERFLAKGESGWIEIAVGHGLTLGATSIRGPGYVVQTGHSSTVSKTAARLVEEFQGNNYTVRRTISLQGDGPWIEITSQLIHTRPATLHSFVDSFQASMQPDWSYSPSVGGFNPDAKYKAPAILVQSGHLAFAIVPDVLKLSREVLKRCNHTLDLDVPAGPVLSVGFIPAERLYHSVYREDADRMWAAGDAVENSYFLYVTANAPPAQAYREVVRFHWSQFGRMAIPFAAAEQAGTAQEFLSCQLWDDWRRIVWEQESRDRWLSVPLPDGSTGGAVRTLRWGNPRYSVYLGAWFNSLRTSLGMALYARRTQHADLLCLAQQTLQFALKAPGVDGSFKCIGVTGGAPDDVRWAAGDGSGDSVEGGYLGFDMSWTGYWLLKWREAELPGGNEVLARCERLADFLTKGQETDGMLPTRFDERGAVQESLSRNVEAETGPVARFLLELYKADPKIQYLRTAEAGLAFLDKNVIPDRKWYDFETFWSCSPRLITFDERTHQWPANDLALIHAVEAYLLAYQATHESPFLNKGEALLDYLLLNQQSWTNPVLENLTGKAMLLGGFTTQNSDAEWSDARGSLAGEVLLDYYRETGKAEYLERGVEALRSQFPISPAENWAHEGYGHKEGVSSFHWGTGSGLAGIEIEEDLLRDAVVDVHEERGVGVNGLNVIECDISGDRISLRIESPFRWTRKPVLIFHHTVPTQPYRLVVNGMQVGTFVGADLEHGVPVPMPTRSQRSENN
jgi:hypothetical protein